MSNIDEYFEALERLKKNKPINIPKGTKISLNAVAMEAGRKAGSIKKSRSIFDGLIQAIQYECEKHQAPEKQKERNIEKYKNSADKYKQLYEEALSREIMLINKIDQLEKELIKFTITN